MCELGDIHTWLLKDADKVIWGKRKKYLWKFQRKLKYY